MILLPSFRQMKLLRYFFVLFSCLGITGLSHAQETSHPKAHKENHLDTFFTKVVWDEYRWLEDYERDDLKKNKTYTTTFTIFLGTTMMRFGVLPAKYCTVFWWAITAASTSSLPMLAASSSLKRIFPLKETG